MIFNDSYFLFLYVLTLRAFLDLGEAQFYSRSLFLSGFHKRIHIRAQRYSIIMTMQVGTIKPRTAVLFDNRKTHLHAFRTVETSAETLAGKDR